MMNIDLSPERVAPYIGKTLLAGITRRDADGNALELKQVHGTILRINMKEGLIIRLTSGEEFALPPMLERLEKAKPGDYRLKSTGEHVLNPDFVVTWSVSSPKPNEKKAPTSASTVRAARGGRASGEA